MKALALVAALILGASCNETSPCCSTQDCAGSNLCTADCRGDQSKQGVCAYRCLVDRDCAVGQVCNTIYTLCGCMAATDSGAVGSCSPNIGL